MRKIRKEVLAVAACSASILLSGNGMAFAAEQGAAPIGEQRAEELALADAGVDAETAGAIRTEADHEQKELVYEVEFVADGRDYDYILRASDGSLMKKEWSLVRTGQTPESAAGPIDMEKAEELAAGDAGYDLTEVDFVKEKSDWDDGISVYELKFNAEDATYEYEIGADDSVIYSVGIEFHAASAANASSGSQEGITLEEAEEIAVSDAGLSTEDVVFTKEKQERDDGRMVYELEFYQDRTEYEYTIDASTGKILESDMDWDD